MVGILYVCPQCGRWQNVALGSALMSGLNAMVRTLGGTPVPLKPVCIACKAELFLADPEDRFLFLSRTTTSERLPRDAGDGVETDPGSGVLDRYREARSTHLQFEQQYGSFLERGERILECIALMKQSRQPLSRKECTEVLQFVGQVLFLLSVYAGTPSPLYVLLPHEENEEQG
jgi:hypothetical protein